MTQSTFHIGVDLGQRRDPSAVAIVERRRFIHSGFDHVAWRPTQQPDPETWLIRRLERIPLGTPYTEVAGRLAALDRHPALRGQSTFIIDATGVGAPVVDMLRARGLSGPLIPVLLTSGQSPHYDGQTWRVPKLDLLSRLQMLFESGRLHLSRRADHAAQLIRELSDIRARPAATGLRIGADAAGQHDDLVIAVALAAWPHQTQGRAPTPKITYGQARIF